MVKVTTKKGDKGTTFLMNGEEVRKDSNIIKLFSSFDKLIAFLGICEEQTGLDFSKLKKLLYNVFSEVSMNKDIKEKHCISLEKEIEKLENKLPPLNRFLIPSKKSAYIHYTRALARECEIRAVSLNFKNLIVFFNRLSDYLFLIAYDYSLKENSKEEF